MSINASIPSFNPSETNKSFIRKIVPKKREISLTDALDKNQNPTKIIGEVFSKPPKKSLFDRGKVVIALNIVEGDKKKTVYAKVNKKALDAGLDIKKEEFINKRTIAENTELVQNQILNKRFQLALEEENPTLVQKRREEAASLGSKDAAYQIAIDYLSDFGIKDDFGAESISKIRTELKEDKQTELKELLENAATLGNEKAMEALGALSSENVDKIAWYKAAAEHGSSKGMWVVGRAYQNGLEIIANKGTDKEKKYEVPKDLNKALEYFNRYLSSTIDEAGHSKAHAAIGDIYKEMNEIDLALKHFNEGAKIDKNLFDNIGDLYIQKAILFARQDKNTTELTDEDVFNRIFETNNKKAEAFLSKALNAYQQSSLPKSNLSIAKLLLAYLPYEKSKINVRNEIEARLHIAYQKDKDLKKEADILFKRLKRS